MKVLVVTPRAYPMTGGVEKHIHELSKQLSVLGDDVTVASHKLSTDDVSINSIIDDVEYLYFNAPLNNYYLISKELVKYVLDNVDNYDVIHLQAIHKPLSIYLLWKLKKAKVKVIFTPHYHGGGHTGLANFAHIFYRKIAAYAIKRADNIIAVSDSEKTLLAQHFPKVADRINVIPNGIIKPDNAKPYAKNETTFITVSRLEPYKRVDTIIKHLDEKSKLIIIGEGPDSDRLKQLAESTGKNVTFTGKVSDDELARWWATADCFVSLSEKEAYGLTLGEALSLGLPAIVSDIPAYEYVGKLAGYPKHMLNFNSQYLLNQQYAKITVDSLRFEPKTVYTWQQAATDTHSIYEISKG